MMMTMMMNRVKLHRRAKFGRNRLNRCRDMAIFLFFKMAAAAILDFKILKFWRSERSRWEAASPCQISSKSVKSRPKYADFSIFQDGGRRHLWFSKFQILNGRRLQDGRTASPCQIWSKSVEPLPRYGDFSIFQDGGRRYLRFLKVEIFNGHTAQEGGTALPRQIWLKSVEPL